MGKMYEMLKAAKIVNTEGGGEPPVFIEKTVTENGTYIALDDEADGCSKVTVDVPSGGVEFSNIPAAFTVLGVVHQLFRG